jgi:hypothetical protein
MMLAAVASLALAPRLATIKANVEQGKCCADSDLEAIAKLGGPIANTYGEITADGMESLGKRALLGPSDVFADLGSGCGRAVIQAVEQFDCAAACGIELGRARHEVAMQLYNALPPERANLIEFICDDCAAPDAWQQWPLADATVVYASSLCFGDELMHRLAAQLAASSRVRFVATLRRFDGGLGGGFVPIGFEPCEMSWTALALRSEGQRDRWKKCSVYLYARPTETFALTT